MCNLYSGKHHFTGCFSLILFLSFGLLLIIMGMILRVGMGGCYACAWWQSQCLVVDQKSYGSIISLLLMRTLLSHPMVMWTKSLHQIFMQSIINIIWIVKGKMLQKLRMEKDWINRCKMREGIVMFVFFSLIFFCHNNFFGIFLYSFEQSPRHDSQIPIFEAELFQFCEKLVSPFLNILIC